MKKHFYIRWEAAKGAPLPTLPGLEWYSYRDDRHFAHLALHEQEMEPLMDLVEKLDAELMETR